MAKKKAMPSGRKDRPQRVTAAKKRPGRPGGRRKAVNGAGVAGDSLTKAPGESKGSLPDTAPCPVVGIGASAGGLHATEALLRALPAEPGLAFVIVQHLSPMHGSMLPELLSRSTAMPVRQAEDGSRVEPNHVFVIPPNANLGVLNGVLQLLEYGVGERERRMPVDFFLSSLAQDLGSRAIGVILSGTAFDGTHGLKAVKAAGGVAFAQDKDTAEYFGMPGNAAAAGCVDFVLPPERIAEELVRIARHPYLVHERPVAPEVGDLFNKIFLLIRSRTGNDFTHYKRSTIERRIKRRMILQKVERLSDYVRFLQHSPTEVQALFQDILISVTSFFRDPETFEVLQSNVFPKLIEGRDQDRPLRIWVPGCASGEEVYSLAIALLEVMGAHERNLPIQMFATDIDERAVESARRGVYPDHIAEYVSPERLRRFFAKSNGGYQISKPIRDLCVFATQNVVKDPPFSRLDMICCRNVLIYLEPVLQKRVIQLFHYALKPGGHLMLGVSESIGNQVDLFLLADKKHKVYTKRSIPEPLPYNFTGQPALPDIEKTGAGAAAAAAPGTRQEPRVLGERQILFHYGPPGVIVNADLEILQFFGKTDTYIAPHPGTASLNLLKMARRDLLVELRRAVRKALKDRAAVRREGVHFGPAEAEERVNLHILPLADTSAGQCLLVLFEPVPGAIAPPQADKSVGEEAEGRTPAEARVQELEDELTSTRDYMQSLLEDQEATNEELQSANEEIQSTNEELQSTNEELETAKEEMQSSNEELATVNDELEDRNRALSEANSDLTNLMVSVELPILMLDTDLRVRQFTPQAAKLFNLIGPDIGRPIGQIRTDLKIPDLEERVLEVTEEITPWSGERQTGDGHWYSVSIRPYRDVDNRISGAVITCVNIDEVRRTERLRQALAEERRLATVVRDANDAITMQDLHGVIRAWNPAAERIYGYSEEEALQMNISELVTKEDKPALVQLLADIREGKQVPPVEIERVRKDGQRVRIWLVATALVDESGKPVAVATTERVLGTST